jgi:tryptophan halogenase
MKITIVGGGTAGWIAAYFISNAQPNKHDITVIESSAIGIIGAGEGSTGSMISFLSGGFFPRKENIHEFAEKTDATPKMGIKHINWGKTPGSYFAPLDGTRTAQEANDYLFKYALAYGGKNMMHLGSAIGLLYENKNHNEYFALHFDGHKVGQFFKEKCEQDGVKTLDAVVKDIILSEDGSISELHMDNQTSITSDLFIDCTGLSRVLMKKLGVNWVSKEDTLPMNTAMPFILEYEPGEVLDPCTTATALSSGWMWDIPLSTRRGCGYVFDRNFITKEEAQKEVEDYLGKPIKPIKFIEFVGGYSESFWYKNVLCLGLSAGFVEPLEATAIHNTIIQTSIFVNECLDSSVDRTYLESKRKMFNRRITFLNELTVDFISIHYQSGKSDSPFWKNITENKIISKGAKRMIDQCKGIIPGYTSMEGMYGSASQPLANWVLAGIDIITPEQAKLDLERQNMVLFAKERYESIVDEIKRDWNNIRYVPPVV